MSEHKRGAPYDSERVRTITLDAEYANAMATNVQRALFAILTDHPGAIVDAVRIDIDDCTYTLDDPRVSAVPTIEQH